MADLNNGYAYLEDIELYGPPNVALAEILIGPRMYGIVAEYIAKVLSHYVTVQGAHSKSFALMESVEAKIDIGGYKRDRWVGQISVGVEYALATEYGRHAYAPYAGNKNLRSSLYAVLPHHP